jgi:transcriptional regulator with XRE-family HTH domain
MEDMERQLRAARALLGKSQLAIEKDYELSYRSVQLLEAGKYKFLPREAYLLKAKYEALDVLFEPATSKAGVGVRWKTPRLDPFQGVQIRAGRGLANISQTQLARLAGVDRNFITRVEGNKSSAVTESSLTKVKMTLAELGVEFLPEDRGFGAGVRWKQPPRASQN